MRRAFLILLPIFSFFFLLSSFAQAQAQYTITGAVLDTFNNGKLENATILLLRSKDSTMVGYARASATGAFTLKADTSKRFILLATYPGMADYVDYVQLDAPGTKDVGVISMLSRKNLLNEFVLRQRQGSIKIKGDTTEYAADSFLVREGANVDELLRKLPGLTVDKNGQVTAQGEKVNKILVDGEEFFSDDPAVVTKNLQSKVVESVQVYDAQSDAAIFTGIDDGVRTKTINLKLKENMKRGAFGKIALGAGPGNNSQDEKIKPVSGQYPNAPSPLGMPGSGTRDAQPGRGLRNGFFENQLMLNAFKGKRQLSIFAITANTGTVGLGWDDSRKYGGNDREFSFGGDDDDDMGWSFSFDNDGDDGDGFGGGQYSGEGLPAAWTGGAHFANKWGAADAQHASANYRYSRNNMDAIGNTLTQYVLPDSSYYTDQRRQSFSTTDRHHVDGLYEWKVDSLTTLKLTANAGYNEGRNNTDYHTESLGQSGAHINTSNRNTNGTTTGKTADATLSYRRKFAKKGRTLIADLSGNFADRDAVTYLTSDNTFFASDVAVFSDTVDQRKTTTTAGQSIKGSASYTEPLSKTLFAEVNYAISANSNSSKRLSYNQNPGGGSEGGYNMLDSFYSSNYDYNVLTNRGGLGLRYVKGKYTLSAGAGISYAHFNQRDVLRDTAFTRNFTNFAPRAMARYKISQMSSVYFSYNGNTRQPSIDQLQPIRQNNDPLNISIGNPQLTQEFDHTFQLRYNDYKVLTGRYVYVGSYASFVQHDITRSETIDQFGRRVYQYVNVNGNYNANIYFGAGQSIKAVEGLRAGFNASFNLNKNNNIINGLKNKNTNNTFGIGLNLNYDVDKKFNLGYNPDFAYNQNKSSISDQLVNYWTMTHNFSGSVDLPLKFVIGTDVDYSIRQKTAGFDGNNNVFVWNAYVAKKFLKNGNLEVRASAFDILNQNLGFRRSANANFVTENRYNTIRRHGLLSVIYNFTYSPVGAKPAGPDAGDIIMGQ